MKIIGWVEYKVYKRKSLVFLKRHKEHLHTFVQLENTESQLNDNQPSNEVRFVHQT